MFYDTIRYALHSTLDYRQFQQAFNRIRGRASSFDHPSYSQTTTNNTMTLLNVPTSAESSISETTTKRKRRNGTSALNISAVDSQPESPSIVVASTKAAGNRVEFELTTIVINADSIPNGYSSQSDEISCWSTFHINYSKHLKPPNNNVLGKCSLKSIFLITNLLHQVHNSKSSHNLANPKNVSPHNRTIFTQTHQIRISIRTSKYK